MKNQIESKFESAYIKLFKIIECKFESIYKIILISY